MVLMPLEIARWLGPVFIAAGIIFALVVPLLQRFTTVLECDPDEFHFREGKVEKKL